MDSERVNVSIPSELFARMEAARGDVSRSKFVQRALESVLMPSIRYPTASVQAAIQAVVRPGTPSARASKSTGDLPKIAPRRWAK